VLVDRQVFEEMRLVGHERETPLGLERIEDEVVAVDAHPPRGRAQDSGERSERGRLAGAIRADQPDDLPCADLERQIGHGGERAGLGRVSPAEVLDGDGHVLG
jgi:hypothetical protein